MTPVRSLRAAMFLCACACILSLLLALALAPRATAAEALGYGELTRFGEVAAGREVETEKGHLSEARTLALGVDGQEENSVFVLEEPKATKKLEEFEKPTLTRFFRLKKFRLSKGKYSAVGGLPGDLPAPDAERTPGTGQAGRQRAGRGSEQGTRVPAGQRPAQGIRRLRLHRGKRKRQGFPAPPPCTPSRPRKKAKNWSPRAAPPAVFWPANPSWRPSRPRLAGRCWRPRG